MSRYMCLFSFSYVFNFQTSSGCVFGTSGCQGSDAQAERDGSGSGCEQHGCVRAEDSQLPGEAARSAVLSPQSTGSIWKIVVSLAERGAGSLPQSCAAARRGWAGRWGGHRCPTEGMGQAGLLQPLLLRLVKKKPLF